MGAIPLRVGAGRLPVNYAVYLDLHGVFLDFLAGVETFHDAKLSQITAENPIWQQLSYRNEAEFWQVLNHNTFWMELPRMAPGIALLRQLRGLACDLRFPIYALTRPMPGCLHSIPGTWLAAIACGFRHQEIVVAYDKLSCFPGFLLDDDPENVQAWRTAGGHWSAFLWPSAFNGRCLDKEGPEFIAATLDLVQQQIISWMPPTTHTSFRQSTI